MTVRAESGRRPPHQRITGRTPRPREGVDLNHPTNPTTPQGTSRLTRQARENMLTAKEATIRANEQIQPFLASAVDGNRRAKTKILEIIYPIVLRYCRARLGRRERVHTSAEDVAQEIVLAASNAINTYEVVEGKPFLSFVYGIASNKVIDAFRNETRDRTDAVDELPEVVDKTAPPEERVESYETTAELKAILETLPESQREVIVLRLLVGLSAEETAEAVGSTPGAVRVAQHRGLATIRKVFGTRPIAIDEDSDAGSNARPRPQDQTKESDSKNKKKTEEAQSGEPAPRRMLRPQAVVFDAEILQTLPAGDRALLEAQAKGMGTAEIAKVHNLTFKEATNNLRRARVRYDRARRGVPEPVAVDVVRTIPHTQIEKDTPKPDSKNLAPEKRSEISEVLYPFYLLSPDEIQVLGALYGVHEKKSNLRDSKLLRIAASARTKLDSFVKREIDIAAVLHANELPKQSETEQVRLRIFLRNNFEPEDARLLIDASEGVSMLELVQIYGKVNTTLLDRLTSLRINAYRKMLDGGLNATEVTDELVQTERNETYKESIAEFMNAILLLSPNESIVLYNTYIKGMDREALMGETNLRRDSISSLLQAGRDKIKDMTGKQVSLDLHAGHEPAFPSTDQRGAFNNRLGEILEPEEAAFIWAVIDGDMQPHIDFNLSRGEFNKKLAMARRKAIRILKDTKSGYSAPQNAPEEHGGLTLVFSAEREVKEAEQENLLEKLSETIAPLPSGRAIQALRLSLALSDVEFADRAVVHPHVLQQAQKGGEMHPEILKAFVDAIDQKQSEKKDKLLQRLYLKNAGLAPMTRAGFMDSHLEDIVKYIRIVNGSTVEDADRDAEYAAGIPAFDGNINTHLIWLGIPFDSALTHAMRLNVSLTHVALPDDLWMRILTEKVLFVDAPERAITEKQFIESLGESNPLHAAIAQERHARSLSELAFSQLIGEGKTFVSNLENGSHIPDDHTLVKIGKKLGKSIHDEDRTMWKWIIAAEQSRKKTGTSQMRRSGTFGTY